MMAACLRGQGDVVISEFDHPIPPEDGVVVEMSHASICGSDVHIVFDGLHEPSLLGRPGYPGHEGVGTVSESRNSSFPVGTRVLTVPLGASGGCFAEFQAVDGAQLIAIPEELSWERALMAQQLGTTVFALKKFMPKERRAKIRTAVVIGAGSAGLYFLQQLSRAGITTVVAERNEQRLSLAEKLGADNAVHPDTESLGEIVCECSDGVGADLVIEAAGYDSCRGQAVELVRNGGVVGLFGYAERPGLSPFPVHRAFRKSVTVEWISGTQSEPGLQSFREALELIRTGTIEVDHCLQSSYPLAELPAALESARAQGRGAAKIGVEISRDSA